MTARGEILPTGDGGETTRWSIEWPALHTVLLVRHSVTLQDDPADLLDGLLTIRTALNASPAEYLLTRGTEPDDG